ncbi:hypothetical protein IGI04_030038 [Brassica rapa subsp. trilocularis]|uniref:Uncharacterized protein n=1 Tax=Brassica rapa subsp. trilocularis TaxID=1813537 RepID=A0ABQ7LQF0_BRACM|nr:hypothetical protein IGI04_030038 [Brassica rapa subsp. trilocularis]
MEMEEAVCPSEACPPFIAPPKDWVRFLQHSRRALPAVSTVLEAKLQVYMWVVESMRSLRYQKWELKVEALATVRCASFIAQSVVNLGLTQSYVASGHPQWLDKFSALGGG